MKRFTVGVFVVVFAGLVGGVRADLIVGTGNTGNCYPFACFPTDGGTTYQQVYAGSAFSGPITITSLSFYLYKSGVMDTGTYKVYLSTTSKAVNGLSTTPANNLGADNALFGTYSVSGSMPPVLTLVGNAFNYNPLNGNLLMDVELVSGTSATGVYESFFQADDTGDVTSRLFISKYGAITDRIGLVTGFNVESGAVPEPSTLLMGATAALLGAGFVRRRSGAAA